MKGLKEFFLMIFGISILCTMQGCLNFPNKSAPDVPVMDGVMHTVREGETLDAIAAAYNVSTQLIERVNNIRPSEKVRHGNRLFIPGATELKVVQKEDKQKAKVVKQDGLWHPVRRGETLIAICRAYDKSIDEIQQVNNITDPSSIMIGQRIWIPGAFEVQDVEIPKVTIIAEAPVIENKPEPRVEEKIVPPPTPTPKAEKKDDKKPTPTPQEFPRKVEEYGPIRFQWPIKDNFRVLREFSTKIRNFNSGIDLGAEIGTPVYAAADGEVQLVGGVTDELGSGYGNHIIIYHGEQDNEGIRTIYAYNSENLVTQNQKVKRGEMIARVGDTGQPAVLKEGGVLHFEVRRGGMALNPMEILPSLD